MLNPKRNLFLAQLFFTPLCFHLILILAPLLCVDYLLLLSDESCNGISHASSSSAEVTNIFFLFYRFIAQDINALKGVSVYATGWFLKRPPASVGSTGLQESLNDEIV